VENFIKGILLCKYIENPIYCTYLKIYAEVETFNKATFT